MAADRHPSPPPPPQLLAPILRAYLLAFGSTAGPRIASLILALLPHSPKHPQNLTIKLWQALKQSAGWNRFPAFCAILVGGSLALEGPLRSLGHGIPSNRRLYIRLATKFLSATVAANIGFNLLNSEPSAPLPSRDGSAAPKLKGTGQYGNLRGLDPTEATDAPPAAAANAETFAFEHEDDLSCDFRATVNPSLPPLPARDVYRARSLQPLAGKTIDLTLFAAVRALDICIAPVVAKRRHTAARIVANSSNTVLFVLSCYIIMRAWFYAPNRLPRSYNRWISSAAQLDPRLLLALRHARYGHFRYGIETGIGPLLGTMCRDYGLPYEWGNPAKTIPIPCELVHQGVGPSCEHHFAHRFAKAWLFAAKMYVPLQLLMWAQRFAISARHGTAVKADALVKALREGARSSAFLAAFISLFYYGVCLGRTRLGPRVFSSKTVTPQMWDGGLAVSVGAWLCGWSVLLEKPHRRTEFAFFVLPRALAVVLPRRYERKYLGRERLAFVLSAAVIMTAAGEKPELVRGVFGRVLSGILGTGHKRRPAVEV
ncbi:integral membrane protein [Phyllosticta citrichinensis]|uniref:Integral membrane protein n=1 Tax=Phyllosticta citrichinensis TaxID=1130410 RepID=A0ABR1Y1J0_9PEZI